MNVQLYSGRVVAIVDDDPSIRAGLSSLLRSLGIGVHSFATAVDILGSQYLVETELLIIDVKMPQMGGLELQDELSRRGVRVPVVFMSAESSPAAEYRVEMGEALCFLDKPFAFEAVAACLDAAFKA